MIKADGLAAGKGVTVCGSVAEAHDAVKDCLVGERSSSADRRVLVEELLEGDELSLLALCDGQQEVTLPAARDAKRALDGNRRPERGQLVDSRPSPASPPIWSTRSSPRSAGPS